MNEITLPRKDILEFMKDLSIASYDAAMHIISSEINFIKKQIRLIKTDNFIRMLLMVILVIILVIFAFVPSIALSDNINGFLLLYIGFEIPPTILVMANSTIVYQLCIKIGKLPVYQDINDYIFENSYTQGDIRYVEKHLVMYKELAKEFKANKKISDSYRSYFHYKYLI